MERTMATVNTSKVSDGKFWLGEDGIVRAIVPRGAEDTLEKAKASLKEIKKTCMGIKRPILVDMRYLKSASYEARCFWAGKETAETVSAVALWVDSPVSKVLGNFYLGLNRSLAPTRLFNDENQALQWLKEHIPTPSDK
jgi:hypothetical protein